ncbi:MAG: ATP-binding cassette domain-containing protein [Proteobacteria bacterium]|nr:ATP-binding cassette domain-containing protein [Pseudomonadota bacterium]
MKDGKAPIIEFDRVSFHYEPGRSLFDQVSPSLPAGGFVLVRGPSGSGKSTLLRLINRLEEPEAGEIRFKGRPLGDYPAPRLRRSLLYIQQTPVAVDAPVRDNLLLPFAFKSNRDLSRPDDGRLRELMDEFLLTGVGLDDAAQTLSVGQLQRMCLIRGLLLEPEVLLLDEPTSALDRESSRLVEAAAERLNQEAGLTVVMVSHKDFEPRTVRPVVLEVGGGRIEERTWAWK